MIKHLLLLITCITALEVQAQNRYVVKFTDKTNTPYSISSPQNFLSQKAINRRAAQGITVDQTDLPVDPSYVQQVAAISGVTLLNASKWFNCVTIEVTSASVMNTVNALPFVINSSNVGRLASTTTHPKFQFDFPEKAVTIPSLKTTSFNYGNAQNQINMININALHDQGYSGQGMLIAVLDAGFQDANIMSCFDSLFLQNRLIATWDFVDRNDNVFDDNWHGSAVLSTMAANVSGDMVGTAPHASYILLRSEDVNSEYIIEEYNWACAAEFADSAGADVINSSLGYTDFDDPSMDHTYADMDGNTAPGTIAADMAASKGILVVNSAGNEGNSAWLHIGCPADGDSVLAIGAVDGSEQYAIFSSQGPSSDGRIKPNVAAQGEGTSVFFPWQPNSGQSSGTSFSGPVIAGSVACLWQVYPMKKNVDVMHAVEMSASQFTTPDAFLGYGIPDFGVASLVLGGYEPSLFNDGLEVIDFYPNPLNYGQALHYRFYSRYEETFDLDVLDMNGRKIAGTHIDPTSSIVALDIDTKLASGVYFIRAVTDEKSIVKKLVIN